MKLILKHTKGYTWMIGLSIALISGMVLAQMMQPNILRDIINEIALGNMENITSLGLKAIIIAMIGLVSGVANTFIAAKISQTTGHSLREEIFHTIQQFSFNNIEKFSTGNLVIRLTNDVQQVQSLIMMLLQSLTRLPLMFIVSFFMAVSILPELWWVIILLVISLGIIMMITFSFLGPRFGRAQRFLEKVNTVAKENFLGIRVVKSFVQEENEIQKFTKESDSLADQTIKIGYIFSTMMPLITIIADGATILAVYLVGGMVEANPSVVSNIAAFSSYLLRISMAIMIGGAMTSFASRAFISIGRINEVLDTQTDLTFGEADNTEIAGNIKFENVSFCYEDANEETLEQISFEVAAGEMVGIIGATGAGKTTLAQLLARIYDPSAGTIFVGDLPLQSFSESALRKNISIVLQRPILFSGTIAENIRQGKEKATIQEMEQAAKIAQAYEFIEKLPNQFESEVYQRGANFSGGQKQRISITRGVVGNPKILILDDSTSALDAKSEKLVKEAIEAKMKDTTKIIISQKISSIVHADKILVLDEGKLVGMGTHKELVQTNDIYKEIYETQKGRAE